MRKYLVMLLLLVVCGGTSLAQTMSDEQVVEYVLQQQEKGMSQNDIVKNLIRRGVTMPSPSTPPTRFTVFFTPPLAKVAT